MKRKKNKVKISACSKRTLNSRNWRKSQFHRKLFHKKQKPGFQKGKVLQRKKAAKRRHTCYTRKGQNAYGVRNSVPIATGYGGKKGARGFSIKLHEHVTEEKRYAAPRKWDITRKKRPKNYVAENRRRKCW